jgi:predicted nucleic acid-binding protein
MIVVSDASPILNLAIVERLGLLRDLFHDVVVPFTVSEELARYGVPLQEEWMRVVVAVGVTELSRLRESLDAGEAEAIIVAQEISADLILLDERRGRREAQSRGLTVTGVLGVLAAAKAAGLISACRPVLDSMVDHAGFWIGEELRARFLAGIGEYG